VSSLLGVTFWTKTVVLWAMSASAPQALTAARPLYVVASSSRTACKSKLSAKRLGSLSLIALRKPATGAGRECTCDIFGVSLLNSMLFTSF
jgi:hypothetical protein